MNWYMSLCTHTDTLKNEFAAMSRVISKGTQHPEYILSDQEIAQLQVPVLWLWGKEDGFAGSEIARRIHGSVEHSQLVEFELAGHLPWLDHSQRHADLIREFLQNETKEVEIREEALKYIA
jgi:pimeloyl-ACP methyl ester carboxylesterase